MRARSFAVVLGALPALALAIVSGCGGSEWKPVAGPAILPAAPAPEPRDQHRTASNKPVTPAPTAPREPPDQAAPAASAAAMASASGSAKKPPAAPKSPAPPKPKK